jgi:hypothetical protein
MLKLASPSSNLAVLPPRWWSDTLPDVHPPKCCLKVRGREESLLSVKSFSWMQGPCLSSEHYHDDLPSLDPAAFAAMPVAVEGLASRQHQHASMPWCSSTSETSKGSKLSLSWLRWLLSSPSTTYTLASSPVIHSGIRCEREERTHTRRR